MSGFVLIFHRDGKPVPLELAAEMLARLDHRGPDGSTQMLDRNLFFGCQHFWTTPEDAGEVQPLVSADQRHLLAFDGRLDNRTTLLEALGLADAEGPALSDGALLLLAFRRWRHDTWRRLLGPFVCALYDRVDHQVICARDALGERDLCYYLDRSLLLVASEPQAMLAHPSASNGLDQETVARLFTWTFPAQKTLFRDICQVVPGSVLRVGEAHIERKRFWSLAEIEQSTSPGLRGDDDYAAEYGRLMAEAVRCRLRINGKSAIKLSGGLDSSAVAALWSLEQRGTDFVVPSYSWVFNNFPACDERTYISELGKQCGLNTKYVNCDSAWTLSNLARLSQNPNQPDLELFRGLQERLHERLALDGVRVVLTGYYGDDLYQGDDGWFASLITDQQWRIVWKILSEGGQTHAIRSLLSSIRVRAHAIPVIGQTPTMGWIGPQRSSALPEWLTPKACEILAMTDLGSAKRTQLDRQVRHARLFNPRLAWFSSLARYADIHHGLEERHPFRDRRLVEFMLTIPTHQLRRLETNRFVLRNAMRKIWPDKITQRTGKTALAQMAATGLCIQERPTFLRLLHRGKPFWSQYVKPAWIAGAIKSDNHRQGCGPELWVPWVCIALTHWLCTHYPGHLEPHAIDRSDHSLST